MILGEGQTCCQILLFLRGSCVGLEAPRAGEGEIGQRQHFVTLVLRSGPWDMAAGQPADGIDGHPPPNSLSPSNHDRNSEGSFYKGGRARPHGLLTSSHEMWR